MSDVLTIGSNAVDPQITSITSFGDGVWELTLLGDPDTGYEFRSSTVLDFDPGDTENHYYRIRAINQCGVSKDYASTGYPGGGSDEIFSDGFESGDTSAWSSGAQ